MYRYKSISFGSSGLTVHHQLDSFDLKSKNTPDENTGRINLSIVKVEPEADLAKGLKDSSEHFFGDVEVQRPHIQTHGT